MTGHPAGGGSDAASPAPFVSVVMACRNPGRLLVDQLEALAGQKYDGEWELVVSDNGSTDGAQQVVEGFRSRLPALVVVDSRAHPGPAGARNVGVGAARGDQLVFCDADDVVADGWLAAMSAALDHEQMVSARLEHQGLNDAWTSAVRVHQGGLQDSLPPWLPYAYAAALGVRRDLHEALGGFDESFLGAGEDREYCYRAQLRGVRLVLVEEAVVHYRHRVEAVALYRQMKSYAWGHVRLYRDYRDLGLGRPSPVRGIAAWAVLAFRLVPSMSNKYRRAIWLGRLGWRVGKLQASLRYRVFAV